MKKECNSDAIHTRSPVVSIVMPVCNSGRFLQDTVGSVLAQTFRDFELILVDDGSVDGSGELCDSFTAQDRRVRVIHQVNGGVCRARNAGIASATGKWLAFSDHDDMWEPDYIEMALAASDGVKIVKVNHGEYVRAGDGSVSCLSRGIEMASCSWDVEGLFSSVDGYRLYQTLGAAVWDGLYDREAVLASGVLFDETLRHGGEDCRFMAQLLGKVKSGVWVGKPLYCHFYNFGKSTSFRCHLDLLDSYLATATEEQRIFYHATPEVRFAALLRWMHGIVAFVFEMPGCTLSTGAKTGWLKRYCDEIVGNPALVDGHAFCAKHRLILFLLRRGWYRSCLMAYGAASRCTSPFRICRPLAFGGGILV